MKKTFTLMMLSMLLFGIGASAQTTLRKTWDFREGFSQKTVNALKADQEEFGADKYWRNYESDATKADQQHFWCASKDAKNAGGYAATHGGGKETAIPELEGLKLGFTAAKKFVITYDGAQKANEFESEGGPAIGEMIPHGKSYVWLNGKNETISFKAEVGQTIKIAVESHAVTTTKLGEARGISLATSAGTLTAKFEGNPVPTYYTEYEWDLAGDAGTVADLTIKSTNGCHIYYIIVGDGDDPNANKTKVSYLTTGDATTESAYQMLASNDQLSVSVIDASTVTAEALMANQITVVSPSIAADAAVVSLLKEVLPFTPILNLNASLYAAWGYGEAVAASQPIAILNDLKHDLFYGFEKDVDYLTEGEGDEAFDFMQMGNAGYTAVKLGDFFADDAPLAVDVEDPSKVALHVHNLYHNAYVYVPAETVELSAKLLANAIDVLKASKSEVTQAPTPKVVLEYKDKKTNITMAMASSNLPKAHIYYTLDGSAPTEKSTEYTEPLTVTEKTTVKAVAIAEGYLLSEVATAEAEIFEQPAAPTIAKEFNEGETAVTLASASENVDIWYNYTESNDTTKSMKYSAPLTFKAPATLTAFAVANGQVFSELTTERVVVKDAVVRIDPLGAQFDANATDWQKGGSGSTVYYFSWGKTARSIYNEKGEPVSTTTDPDTGDEIIVYPEYDYEYYVPVDEEGKAKGWEVKSKGQVMIWQSLTVGKDPGNGEGYNPDTAGDILDYAPITSNDIQFGGKTSGEPCTGAIQSTAKYQGPFDIVTIIGTAAGGDNVGRMLLEVSTDSIEWQTVGEEMKTSTVKRLWKTYTTTYNGTDEVYVRLTQAGGGASVQIYNIYVLNAGEQSAAKKAEYDEEYKNASTGIRDIKSITKAVEGIYNLNGIRQRTLQRGMNIVVTSDGSVKKVVVK